MFPGTGMTSPKGGFPEPLYPDISLCRDGGRVMIENIFLTYANHFLRDEPKHFYKIFGEIASYFSISFSLNSDLKKVIDLVLKFTEINDPVKAQESLEQLRSSPDKIYVHSPLIITQQTYVYG